MEIILLIIFVGKRGHEVRGQFRPLQLLRQSPQRRHTHADDQGLVYRGHQGCMKVPVACVLQGEKPLLDLRHGFFTPP